MKKKTNTFQFVSFNERIKKTHVDVVRQYKAFGSLQPIDAETFFSETLEKWSDLNGTGHFDDFKKSIPRSELYTYVQILHNQKKLATSLMENLKIEGSLCIPALLDLTVALCRDLQEDFYVYFWEFFEVIQEILRNTTSENADLIEACFTTYAYLFKFCRRRMLLELELVLRRLIPLISNKKYYVRRFVSESVAFLMRKCPNFDRLVQTCDTMIVENARLIEGMADIFFESMKSIRSQLHTTAPKIYSALLNLETASGLELTKIVTKKLSMTIDGKSLRSIFEILSKKTEEKLTDSNSDAIKNLFELWSVWADSSNPNPLTIFVDEIFEKILIPAVSDQFLTANSSMKFVLNFVSTFWPLMPANQILSKKFMQILLHQQRGKIRVEFVLHFLESLLKSFEEFQSIILPDFIDFSEFYFSEDQLSVEKRAILRFWAKICNENRSILNENYDISNSFCVKYSRKMPKFVEFLQGFLSRDFENEKIIDLYAALAVYSNFSKNSEPILKIFSRFLNQIGNSKISSEDCFVIFLIIRCLKQMDIDEKSIEISPIKKFLDQLKIRPYFLPLLNVFNEILSDFPTVIEEITTNLELLKILEENFLSPSTAVRKKTLQILTKLKWSAIGDAQVEQNLFDLALESESVDLYLDTYRDRLTCYRKFGFTEYERLLPEPVNQFRFVPLKFLLGQLNVNFTLLSPTLLELIESHARGQNQNEFWSIFGEILKSCHDRICKDRSKSIDNSANLSKSTNIADGVDNVDPFFSLIIDQFAAVDERRPDYENFRQLLWKSVENFADLAESKSRYLSDLLLSVAQNELVSIDYNCRMDENLTVDSIDDGDDHNAIRTDDSKRRKSFIIRTLTSILNVFSKFNNPKSVAKEEKLYRLYLDLLMHGRCEIQKAALECVLAYRSKFITPYRENLLNLLNDKLFKDQLVLFNIDSDANVVEPEHRADVMQIVLRLVYGRLLGKGSDSYRKQQIYRFLAGSTDQELKIFLEFMFLPYQKYLDPQTILMDVCTSILINYDLTKSIALRKIMGILSHLSSIIKRLGHILIDYRSNLFRVCCISGSILLTIQNKKDQIQPHYVKFCKKLRRLLTQRFTEFFVQFDSYEFHPDEIRLFYKICIWPLAENLNKNLGQPSVDLIKLCLAISEISRFFILLGVYDPSYCRCTLLELLLDRLIDKQCRKSIKQSIVTIVYNLLSISDYESSDETGYELKIPDNFVRRLYTVDETRDEISATSLGARLILPYADRLLTYLSGIATIAVCRNEKWMKILTVLSEYTKDETNCERLSVILLSVLKSKKIRNVEIESSILISVKRLLKNVAYPLPYANNVAELLYVIENRASRNILIDIVDYFARCRSNLEPVATILDDVNSWNPDRVEEPNFDRIQSGYGRMSRFLSGENSDRFDFVGCSFLWRNCAFFMTKATDNSLRDQSADCCRNLIQFTSKQFETTEARKFLSVHILPVLRLGLKSKIEAVRHEFITILSACVKFFKPEHPKFEGFTELTDINDEDLNFFDNIRHIQLHRRSRAIRRICNKLETSSLRVHSESLFNYIYPIFYAFFFDAAYSKNSNLIDESIRFLSVFCSRAPWVRYETMLRYFLDRLCKDVAHQKLMVKIIVAILDSFHFDISGVDEQSHSPSTEDQPVMVNVEYETKKRIFDTIVKKFIPELQNSLSKRTSTEFGHKTTAKFIYDEDEEILRIPIALAIVKLLQKLPEKYLDLNLPGVISKVCQMLKSRSWDIREGSRKMLCRMAESLGSRYAAYIIREMRAILRRGYQLHVLTYTVHILLTHLSETLAPGDLEPCLNDVLMICVDDLFGDVSQQKEHIEITRKLKEAKSNKTNRTFQILGRLIDPPSLDIVVDALRNVLEGKYTHLTVGKVGEALKFFSQGLILNTHASTELLMTFIHKLLSNNTAIMLEVGKSTVEPANQYEPTVSRVSCYVLQPEPKRAGSQPKKSKRSNLHIMVAFGLEILQNLLKTKRLEPANQLHCSLIDPFLTLLVDLSKAKQPKVVSLALRCLCSSLQFSMPSMTVLCPTVVQHLFVLLKRFAGSDKAENVELLTVVFKTVTLMIKDLEFCGLDANQLRIILQYAEEDLFDIHKQSTAFALIKAILARKFICDEIKSLIRRVEELSIVSQIDTVRLQCRQVIGRYMTTYPEGKRPKHQVEFFCAQFEYEYEDGRISALEMIQSIIDFLNQDQLNEFFLFIFVHLSLRLVNDESPKIKQLSSVTIKNLLMKLDVGQFESIFQMMYEWLKDENVVHKKLAAILFGVTAGVGPVSTIHSVLTIVVDQLTCAIMSSISQDDLQIAGKDHFVYLLLSALEKYLVSNPTVVRDAKFTRLLNDVWVLIIKCVDHEHVWVRLVACRLIGLMLSRYKPEELLCFDISSEEFLLRNSKSTVGLLCEACLRRFRSVGSSAELSEQVIKNLVFLSRCIRHLNIAAAAGDSSSRATTPTEEDAVAGFMRRRGVDSQGIISLERIAKQLIRVCRQEVSKYTSQTVKRTNVFKWFAAICLDSTVDEFTVLLPIVLPSLYREMTVGDADPNLKQLASEVEEIVKNKIGMAQFSMYLAKIQKMSSEKRLERKRKLADDAINRPEMSAMRKIRRHQSRIESKKRKFSEKKGKKRKNSSDESKSENFHLNIEDD